jgi:prepilin-type N-terminal cleavage/methylation domain-containing protein
MLVRTYKLGKRPSFTLIELLIVIAIIGVLISLTTGVYIRVYRLGYQLSNRSDITQLDIALNKFKTEKGAYPPSQIKLAHDYSSYNTANQLDLDSVAFLTRIFDPRMVATWQTTGIDWTGQLYVTGTAGMTTGSVIILEGDQCMVFFLGGVLSASRTPQGFTNNPTNPMDSTGGYAYQGAYYQFKSNRLVNLPHTITGGDATGIFPSYLDTYGKQAFAYFSSYNLENGYNRYSATVSDCPTLGVWPYASSLTPTASYQNPSTFQIISAGFDQSFGSGSNPTVPSPVLWSPGTASQAFANDVLQAPQFGKQPAGNDDMANFSSVLLGVNN